MDRMTQGVTALLGYPSRDEQNAWITGLSVDAFPFLADHRLGGAIVVPGAVAVEIALAVAEAAIGPGPHLLADVRFERVCLVPTSGVRRLRSALQAHPDGGHTLAVTSPDARITYAMARIASEPVSTPDVTSRVADICATGMETPGDAFYTALESNDYGPAFRRVQRLWRQGDEAVAILDPCQEASWWTRPVFLDAAVQVVTAAAGLDGKAFVWAGCDQVRLLGMPQASSQAYARVRSGCGADQVIGDVVLVGPDGQPTAEITGVRVHPLRTGRVLLVRAEEMPENGDGARFHLPGVGQIAHLHSYETEYLHDEIFVRNAYLRHGITLRPGDTVFDVGANIGMFTLFAHQHCPGVRVYAFEPAGPAFDALRENSARYCPGSQVFNYGISDREEVRPFTFYRNSTVFSGFAADPGRDAKTIRTVIENAVRSKVPPGSIDIGPIVDRLLRDRLDASVHSVVTKTLSTALKQTGADRIDLLKIDTEGSEIQVLRGIEEDDWDRIRQIVLEVHDGDTTVVTALLQEHGFDVLVDRQEDLLRGTPLINVFARRADDSAVRSSQR